MAATPLNHRWDGIDLNTRPGQTILLLEYQIHNLSDGDFVESMAAVKTAELLLETIAKHLGYDSADKATYNNKFRNIVFAQIGPEKLALLYSSGGLDRVVEEVTRLLKTANFRRGH